MPRVEARPINAKPVVPRVAPLKRDVPEVPTDPQRRQNPTPASPPGVPDTPVTTPIPVPVGR